VAYTFSLSAECGSNQQDAEHFAGHFRGHSMELITGKVSTLHATVHCDEESNWWAVIEPDKVSRSGVATLDDAVELSELGFRLYALLMSAPDYRFALVGVEVDDSNTYEELLGQVATYSSGKRIVPNFEGLVLSNELWQEMGRPLAFFPFGERYRWNPYRGEDYSPTWEASARGERLLALRRVLPSA